MKKRLIKYSLCFLCCLCLFVTIFLSRRNRKEEPTTLTICTEEALLYEVEEVVRYFNGSHEEPVDIQISCIPFEQGERAGVCKKYRTELMTGKGADIYIMKDYGISRHMAVSEEDMLLADPNKLLTSGVFLDLSEYTKEDEEFQQCFEPVMQAGAQNGKQYIVPFTFDVTLLKGSGEKGVLTVEDCMKPLPELIEEGKLNELSPESFLFYVTEWIGNSFDYRKGKVLFSEEDVRKVLEYSAKEASKGIRESAYEMMSVKDERVSDVMSGGENTEYHYLPFPSLNGGFNASILTYGAVSRTCKEPELAYELLKVFWSKGFATGEGLTVQEGEYSRYYTIDTIFDMGGITVRQDQWQNWYENKPENNKDSENFQKNEENLLSVLERVSSARFICTIDYLGMDIRNMFWKDGFLNVEQDGILEDIQTASEMLYNSTRYVVME